MAADVNLPAASGSAPPRPSDFERIAAMLEAVWRARGGSRVVPPRVAARPDLDGRVLVEALDGDRSSARRGAARRGQRLQRALGRLDAPRLARPRALPRHALHRARLGLGAGTLPARRRLAPLAADPERAGLHRVATTTPYVFDPGPVTPDGAPGESTGPAHGRPGMAGSALNAAPSDRRAQGEAMPIATPEVYADMLDRAKAGSFAYPAINVSSSQTLNAALKGFADAGCDGIIQVSTGGAEYLSGPTVKNMVSGSLAFAAFAHEVAKNYPVNIALHTDHCPKDKLDGFVRPLLAASTERVKAGGTPWFQSHMWDGSAVPLDENLEIARELLALAKAANVILEIEVGVVGGEEDGVVGAIDEKLYSTPEDAIATIKALGPGENGRYLTALTFGNVHGVYKPGNVKLRPEILQQAQEAVVKAKGLADDARPFDLVFHGGSGSLPRRSPQPSTTASSR